MSPLVVVFRTFSLLGKEDCVKMVSTLLLVSSKQGVRMQTTVTLSMLCPWMGHKQ